MKKFIVISLITLFSVFLTFSLTEKDKVTLKGKVTTQNRQFAEFKSENKDYILMMPHYYLNDIKDNESVEVEGYKIDKNALPPDNCMGRFSAGNSELFYVTKLTINGKAIDIEKDKNSLKNPGMGHGGRWNKNGNMRGGYRR